jgi:adenosylmethionine-8-amino-7-oxononanoate aminotransferase
MNLANRDFECVLHPFSSYQADVRNIVIKSGKGALLFDEKGKSYIDAVSSWWVNLHGHSNPVINRAIKSQIDELEHVMFAGFTHEPAVQLAEQLIEILPGDVSRIFFSDNGSTAVEVALKLAIQYHSNQGRIRKKFIAFQNAYHGDTFGAMAVSERDVFVKPFENHLFEVIAIPLPNEQNISKTVFELKQILENEDVAGFIFEPLVQGAGGMRMYPSENLDKLIDTCRQYDVVCIADEVMTGFGRTGTFFASDQLKNKPDLICLSKGITGGYFPLGATSINHKVMKIFENKAPSHTFYHGHSFTGNPLSCAAANASINLLKREECQMQIRHIHRMHLEFSSLLEKTDWFEDVRVSGTIIAANVKSNHEGYFYNNPLKETLKNYFLEKGIIMRPLGNVLYCLPPYCISINELDQIYDAWKEFHP